MYRKTTAFEGKSLPWCSQKGEIPYHVDNLFYESFGMSCDEVFETLMKRDFLLMG